MQFWQMKPVQMAAKSVAAGSACVGLLLAFRTTSTFLLGRPDEEARKALIEAVGPSLEKACAQLEATCLEALARLTPFRRFAPEAFDHIVRVAVAATLGKEHEYKSRPITASASFRMRSDFQKIIEAIRVFRAFIEVQMPSTLEDFDEVAVDLNAYVEQVCTDAVQDTFT